MALATRPITVCLVAMLMMFAQWIGLSEDGKSVGLFHNPARSRARNRSLSRFMRRGLFDDPVLLPLLAKTDNIRQGAFLVNLIMACEQIGQFLFGKITSFDCSPEEGGAIV